MGLKPEVFNFSNGIKKRELNKLIKTSKIFIKKIREYLKTERNIELMGFSIPETFNFSLYYSEDYDNHEIMVTARPYNLLIIPDENEWRDGKLAIEEDTLFPECEARGHKFETHWVRMRESNTYLQYQSNN